MPKFPLEIIEENQHFLVINKPQGLIVNKSVTANTDTLQQMVTNYIGIKEPKNIAELSQNKQEFYNRGGVVHRLDKDTTGAIVVAKTPDFYVKVKKEFLSRKVKKAYTAVTFNNLTPFFDDKAFLKVNLPLARNPENRSQFAVVKRGRDSVSEIYLKTKFNDKSYSPTTYYKSYEFSLIKIVPKTGRTHQIRVHCKALNAEILGDTVYSGRKQKSFANKNNITLMLHARELGFLNYNFKAIYPKHFVDTVNKLWGF